MSDETLYPLSQYNKDQPQPIWVIWKEMKEREEAHFKTMSSEQIEAYLNE